MTKKTVYNLKQEFTELNNVVNLTSINIRKLDNQSILSKGLSNVNNFTAIVGRSINAIKSLSSGFLSIASSVKDFGSESFDAFNKSEVSLNRLRFGLQGMNDIGSLEKLVTQSKELQNISIFSNEDIQNSMAMLTSLKMNSSQIEETIPSILDLASAYTQVTGDADGLNTVTRLLSTTAGDELYRALEKVGVSLSDVDKKNLDAASGSERLNMVMGLVKGKFEGLSQTLSGTTLGGMQQLSNVWNDIQVAIGGAISEALLPVIDLLKELWPAIKEGITNLASFAEEWVNTMTEAAGSKMEFDELKTVLMSLIKDGFNKIIEVGRELMPTFKEFYTSINELKGENTSFIDVLKDVASVIIELIAWFLKWTAEIHTATIKTITFIKDVNSSIEKLVKSVFKWFSDPIPSTWVEGITGIVDEVESKIKGLVNFFKGIKRQFDGEGEGKGSGRSDNDPERDKPNTIASPNEPDDVSKLRIEQEQKEEELMRMQLGYANDMWSNFQGMLQATGLMKGQFGEIISFINSFISTISSGVSFFESLVGFIGSIIPGGGAIGAIAGQASGMPRGASMSMGLPRVSVPERTEIPFMGGGVSSNNIKYNVEMPEVRLKGSDLYLSWRRQKTIQDKRTQ